MSDTQTFILSFLVYELNGTVVFSYFIYQYLNYSFHVLNLFFKNFNIILCACVYVYYLVHFFIR